MWQGQVSNPEPLALESDGLPMTRLDDILSTYLNFHWFQPIFSTPKDNIVGWYTLHSRVKVLPLQMYGNR